MSKKSCTLIHTALQAEARPIVDNFGLKSMETSPFRVYGSPGIFLIVSGVGREAARQALELFTSRYSVTAAINIGLAGCSGPEVKTGTLYAVYGGAPGLMSMPFRTVDTPITGMPRDDFQYSREHRLYDMEAQSFLDILLPKNIPVHVLKIVSDHLDGTFPNKKTIHELVHNSLPLWDSLADPYPAKIRQVFMEYNNSKLTVEDRLAIRAAALHYRFSFQELKHLVDIALDYTSWDLPPLARRLHIRFPSRQQVYRTILDEWNAEKNHPISWNDSKFQSNIRKPVSTKIGKKITEETRRNTGFGHCPVASEHTRCCNLMTLDAVEGCGFDCGYCSIRYFYNSEKIIFDRDFSKKLAELKLDPDRDYHIGTGQSSDSLMWGNRAGILEQLVSFAGRNPNVILEFKTKSDNVEWLLTHPVPRNVLVTWSLNPRIVIDNEEHLTASLEKRLHAARQVANRGILTGFHFHPIIYMEGWESAYGEITARLLKNFDSDEVAMVSLGTLTFIKPLIKQIRSSLFHSRILKMPMVDANGKYSYPLDIKRTMFRHLYNALKQWHGKVFFYLCMEDPALWPDVFGFDYSGNDDFERDMIRAYRMKITST